MKRIFAAFKDLEEEDFRALASVEAGLRRREYVPKEDLLKYLKSDLPDLDYRLARLDRLALIQSQGTPYKGYRLLARAYDFLALHVLVRRERIESIGDKIAVGKESEIYEALGADGLRLVVKLHRLGMTSFHRAARLRGYLGDRHHVSWIYAARLAAEREYRALTKLKDHVPVPKPIDQNRNAVLMERFDGAELTESEVARPQELLEAILSCVHRSQEVGIIHGDLSEYNVLVNEDGFVIIDWPQWVDASHPQAKALLQRDISNILNFFKKRYGTEAKY